MHWLSRASRGSSFFGVDPSATVLSVVPYSKLPFGLPLWASRISQQLIQIGFSMWEHRNSIKHSDLSLQAQARIRQVDDAIHSQFDMGTADLPQASRRFLSSGRQQVLRKSLADKETWLKLLRGERRAQRRSLQSTSSLLSTSRCPIMTLIRESTPFFTPPCCGRAFLLWMLESLLFLSCI